jgi:hypothetical protein
MYIEYPGYKDVTQELSANSKLGLALCLQSKIISLKSFFHLGSDICFPLKMIHVMKIPSFGVTQHFTEEVS